MSVGAMNGVSQGIVCHERSCANLYFIAWSLRCPGIPIVLYKMLEYQTVAEYVRDVPIEEHDAVMITLRHRITTQLRDSERAIKTALALLNELNGMPKAPATAPAPAPAPATAPPAARKRPIPAKISPVSGKKYKPLSVSVPCPTFPDEVTVHTCLHHITDLHRYASCLQSSTQREIRLREAAMETQNERYRTKLQVLLEDTTRLETRVTRLEAACAAKDDTIAEMTAKLAVAERAAAASAAAAAAAAQRAAKFAKRPPRPPAPPSRWDWDRQVAELKKLETLGLEEFRIRQQFQHYYSHASLDDVLKTM